MNALLVPSCWSSIHDGTNERTNAPLFISLLECPTISNPPHPIPPQNLDTLANVAPSSHAHPAAIFCTSPKSVNSKSNAKSEQSGSSIFPPPPPKQHKPTLLLSPHTHTLPDFHLTLISHSSALSKIAHMLKPTAFGGWGRKAGSDGGFIEVGFSCRCPPTIKPRTRIIAVCRINDSRNASSPEDDGWFHSDFYLFHHLFLLAQHVNLPCYCCYCCVPLAV